MSIENTVVRVDCGKGILRDVDVVRDIHESVFAHVLTRGLKPTLQDCHASVTLDSCGGDSAKQQEESAALVDKMLANMKSGDVRVRGVTRESSADPMSRFRIAALADMIKAADSKKWTAINKAENRADIIKALLEKNAETIEPRALELKAEDDAKKAKSAELAKGLDLLAFGL